MKIAVLSDAHDNIWNVRKALTMLHGTEAMIFCGDFCSPFTLKMLADGFTGPVHCILGNNDGDALRLAQIASQADNVILYQGAGHIEYGGRSLAFAHYPVIGRALALSGAHDAVFSGHTHRAKIEIIGETLWANPGEVMGAEGEPSFGIYDTEAGALQMVRI